MTCKCGEPSLRRHRADTQLTHRVILDFPQERMAWCLCNWDHQLEARQIILSQASVWPNSNNDQIRGPQTWNWLVCTQHSYRNYKWFLPIWGRGQSVRIQTHIQRWVGRRLTIALVTCSCRTGCMHRQSPLRTTFQGHDTCTQNCDFNTNQYRLQSHGSFWLLPSSTVARYFKSTECPIFAALVWNNLQGFCGDNV